MSSHVRAGAALALCALTAQLTYAYSERVTRAPRGRFLRFSPGSQDAAVEDTLRTGDLLLFSRDCAVSGAASSLACIARQARGGSAFDGAGVVVLLGGEPWVLESRAGAPPALRRYAARVLASRAREILLRPVRPPLAPAAAAALEAAAVREGVRGSDDAGADNARAFFDVSRVCASVVEAVRLLAGDARAAAPLVGIESAGRAAGLAGDLVSAAALAPPSQPWAATSGVRFGAPVWVRDLR
jgi:hypothetical protein